MRQHFFLTVCLAIFFPIGLAAEPSNIYSLRLAWIDVVIVLGVFAMLMLLAFALSLYHRTHVMHETSLQEADMRIKLRLRQLTSEQITTLLKYVKSKNRYAVTDSRVRKKVLSSLVLFLASAPLFAQSRSPSISWSNAGIAITIALLLVPIIGGLVLMIVKIRRGIFRFRMRQREAQTNELTAYLATLEDEETLRQLAQRREAMDYRLSDEELARNTQVEDRRGLIASTTDRVTLPIAAEKKRALKRPDIDPKLGRLVLWYIGTAAFWLIFGTTVGQYLGIKFLAPDADQLSWLSFGRLRPVHTNAVFWGWASLGMLGLGYYIVPRVGNVPLANLKWGWYSLILVNATVVLGTLSLMAGINNGGGEYREYIWPIMALFGIALALTLVNFLKTVSRRKTVEIYIANWYIVSAVIFAIVIAAVAYLPFWQNGLGETIVQGYYMHQGVGMWFMLFTLGIVYYFLPQQLNKPIYSYSLGILAFWTQILFYTLIGTHHFIFSAIPWWLQTVAIVGSAGMVIPVVAGTANFLLTFKNAWYKIKDSYTLPFFLAGIIFYFTGSMQGTAEAFRYTNLIWHFTDFTVAHSHLTMYGIICFLLWGGMYAVIPRLTGKEPPQLLVGAHFWLALIGLMFYTVPLMYGGTLRGLMWMEGRAFMESVVMMAPYWLWRAIGGSLMWLSHLFFAVNLYKMFSVKRPPDVPADAIRRLTGQTA